MASYLQDTNVLLRSVHLTSPEHLMCLVAINTLQARGDAVHITPQNLVELWSVATRPVSANGLGLSPQQVESEVQLILGHYMVLKDDPTIFDHWHDLVRSVGVSGRQVHDARRVAVMYTYGVTHLLTLNGTDFARYPGVMAVHPGTV
jgi:predicted nucleic acid-binding protein